MMAETPDRETSDRQGQPAQRVAALFGSCPRCGAATLFDGPVSFAPECSQCGLDFSRFNVGDGPAAFLTFGVGGLVTALAIWLELAAGPPFWVHILLWVPLTAALVIGGLRVAKAWLLRAEYRQRASEARTDDTRPDTTQIGETS